MFLGDKAKPYIFVLLIGLAAVQLLFHSWARAETNHFASLGSGIITRVSIASDGTQANGGSGLSALSADGRYVTFQSNASNLVPGDTNSFTDIFVHDRHADQTSRVSVASDGTEANRWSQQPSISADGRYVAFNSLASNLVPNDTNNRTDIFVHDRQTGQTSRISITSNGVQSDSDSYLPAISADGRYVAFYSNATNLTPDTPPFTSNVFVHDRQTGETSRIGVAWDGAPSPFFFGGMDISADGRYVVFGSWSDNVVPGDTNGMHDIFVYDRQTGQTSLVSVASDGTQANDHVYFPSISADGRYVTFSSDANSLVPGDTNGVSDVFVHDRLTGQTSRVSVASDGTQGNNASAVPAISADSRFVTFTSRASNLVPGPVHDDWNIFLHDRETGQTTLISAAADGTPANDRSARPRISADGRHISFDSLANNLVSGDTNGEQDIFVYERVDPPPPTLTINYTTGAPGSYFTVTGVHFPPDSQVTIMVNSWQAGMVNASGDGEFLFLLTTVDADEGAYFVTASVNPRAVVSFTLDGNAPTRPQEDTGEVFNVPAGIALTEFIYLPAILR
jgi:Tol biopolymer transport system component